MEGGEAGGVGDAFGGGDAHAGLGFGEGEDAVELAVRSKDETGRVVDEGTRERKPSHARTPAKPVCCACL